MEGRVLSILLPGYRFSEKKENLKEMFCSYRKTFYICTRNLDISPVCTRFTPAKGPFVYRLGRKIFILERGVRFPYGLQ